MRATVAIRQELSRQIDEREPADACRHHPDAAAPAVFPDFGLVLGAPVLAGFGVSPNRHQDAEARRCNAGTAPIIRVSGSRRVVLARIA